MGIPMAFPEQPNQPPDPFGHDLNSAGEYSDLIDLAGTDNPPNMDSEIQPFWWWRDLSLDAQRLYQCLIEERGDLELLPVFAVEDDFNLHAALNELRRYNILDESDPERIRLR